MRRLLLATLLVSAGAIGYELLLMRVLSIVQWHHFAYMIISLALLGYGASGTFLALYGQRLKNHFDAAFVGGSMLFGLSSLACVAIAQRLPFDPLALTWDAQQIVYLAGTFLVLALPFFAAASCIGLALWRFPDQIPRLYGYDLIGAGLGAVALMLALALLAPAASQAEPIVRSFEVRPGGELEVDTDTGSIEISGHDADEIVVETELGKSGKWFSWGDNSGHVTYDISVPANTTHWFDMGESPDFKCIRFFTTPDGWQGNFTGSDIATRFPSFDAYLAERA